MSENSIPFRNTGISKILFILSISCLVFWFLGHTIDVYRFAVVGAIFEILWLMMLLGLFVLPIVSIVFLIKEKFHIRSLYLYCILINISTILMMIFFSK
jgi:hypothetical protein